MTSDAPQLKPVPARRPRIAILLSGRGSNFLALARACADGELPADIGLVLSNKADAGGLVAAAALGLPTRSIEHKGMSRKAHEAQVVAAIEEAGCDWICLAGYMRLLSHRFVDRFHHRIVNIHPSLLPSFPGLHVHEQALEYGVRVSGCTVHLVDAGLDTGPIVDQRSVNVEDHDTPDALAARVLEQEHVAYAAAMRRLITEPWTIEGRRVRFG